MCSSMYYFNNKICEYEFRFGIYVVGYIYTLLIKISITLYLKYFYFYFILYAGQN